MVECLFTNYEFAGLNPIARNFRYRACFEQEVLDIQATIECGFTLKRVRDMIIAYSRNAKYLSKMEKDNSGKTRKILIVFHDMLASMISNKEFNPIVAELFFRGKKLKFLLHNHILRYQKILD